MNFGLRRKRAEDVDLICRYYSGIQHGAYSEIERCKNGSLTMKTYRTKPFVCAAITFPSAELAIQEADALLRDGYRVYEFDVGYF